MTDVATEPKKRRYVTVTGDIGEVKLDTKASDSAYKYCFRKGQVLIKDDAIVNYYRLIYNEDPPGGVECKLTDAQILEIFDDIPGDDEDAEVLRIEKMQETIPAGASDDV